MASPNLTETQSLILSMASQRDDGRVVLPGSLKGAAAPVVLRSLERRGYIVSTDVPANLPGLGHLPGPILQPFRITSAGLAAIGVEEDDESDDSALPPALAEDVAYGAQADEGTPSGESRRANTKRAQLIALLATPEGATTATLVETLGWLPHTLRAALSGLRKAGHDVVSFRTPAGEPSYRISSPNEGALA